jgi:hypothetical protein
VRPKFEFDFGTTAMAEQVIELMTDFSPNRPHRWPRRTTSATPRPTSAKARISKPVGQVAFRLVHPGSVTLTVVESDALVGVTVMRFIGPWFLLSYFKSVYDGLAA